MPSTITKFQPDRQLYLRGFSGLGAAAAITNATPTGFTVSGIFRSAADFAVAVIFDIDDFYSHPRFKPLPDPNLTGLVLEYDAHYMPSLAPLDSRKFPTIDFPYLDYTKTDGTTGKINLSPNAATPVTTLKSGNWTKATGVFTINLNAPLNGDRLSIWYQNYSWVYSAAGTGDTAPGVATYLANQINATNWGTTALTVFASASGSALTITCNQSGADGNSIRLYALSSNPSKISLSPTPLQLAGGSSDVTWHVRLDFSLLGLTSIRQMWLTFAPALADAGPFVDSTWDAHFSNWGITADPSSKAPLSVAGVGSVRVEEDGATLTGAWTNTTTGWWSQGGAVQSAVIGNTVQAVYTCGSVHELLVGTALSQAFGAFSVTLDGVAQAALDTYVPSVDPAAPIYTRRTIASGVAAGTHTVILTVKTKNAASTGTTVFFDFLEAAVKALVPDPPGYWYDRSPAIDYDTQHGYQLPPSRLLWMFDALGFTGPMNLYIGVFWWNQRKAVGRTLASATIDFASVPLTGASGGIFVVIGGATIGKSVELRSGASVDTTTTVAAHFAHFINGLYSGVWASSSGSVLTITVRAETPAYQQTLSAYYNDGTTNHPLTTAGSLSGSAAGTWVIDPAQTPTLNYAAAKWHADLFAQVKTRNNVIAASFSLELVNPPDDGVSHIWAARFRDNAPVSTATGFSNLYSTQCAPLAPEFTAYQQAAYLHLAQLQSAAGLTPYLQLGEFLWWFFAQNGSMAFYDLATSADAQSVLGRPLTLFTSPTDSPAVNGYADADFLANRLANHVNSIISYVKASYPSSVFELLYANDVNNPAVSPVSQVGGQLNAYVNLPLSWKSPRTAPFDIFKLEQLAYGTTDKRLDWVTSGLQQMMALDWGGKIRYLYPVDTAASGAFQWSEYRAALASGISQFTPFAVDHICLYGWATVPPTTVVTTTSPTQGQLISETANRLDDAANVYWSVAELRLYLAEALRTWQSYTGWYRQQTTFVPQSNTVWNDLTAVLPQSVFGFNVTDQYLTGVILFHLLESQLVNGAWTGTGQFTAAQVQAAMQRRLNRFLGDTGAVVSRSYQSGVIPSNGRVSVPSTVIDVRRVAWVQSGVYTHLWRASEWEANAFAPTWQTDAGPVAYSTSLVSPASLQLIPALESSGDMELITVSSGPRVDFTRSGVLLQIPDDLSWGVKWGTLAELLTQEGEAKDVQRAAYCEERYQEAVELARRFPSVLNASMAGRTLYLNSVFELDTFYPNWQNQAAGGDGIVALIGRNMAAISPTGQGRITLDLVSNMALPQADTDPLQVPDDVIPVLLNYIEHLAAFKMGGEEFLSTRPLHANMLIEAASYNSRLREADFFSAVTKSKALGDNEEVPRLVSGKSNNG